MHLGLGMTEILRWVAAHYVGVGLYLLGVGIALLVAALGAALPVVGLTSRWPRWLAACAGLLLVLFGIALAAAKLAWASPLRQVSWLGPSVMTAFGLILMGTAWALERKSRQRTREHLRPMIDAAWRGIESRSGQVRGTKDVVLTTPDGRRVNRELASMISRRRLTQIVMLTGPAGAGKTTTLVDLAGYCHATWVERRGRAFIPVYVDLADFAREPSRISLRDFIMRELGQDEDLNQSFAAAWRDTRPGAIWVFLFDNVDRVLARWPADQRSYSWANELADFMGANGRSSRAVVAGYSMANIPNGIRVEIAPVSRRSRSNFLMAQGVAAAQRDALSFEKTFRQYAANLAWLDMVSAYLATRTGDGPESFHDLMAKCVDQKMSSTGSGSIDAAEEQIHKIAQAVAIRLCGYQNMNDSNVRSELVQDIAQGEGYPAGVVDAALSTLASHGLMSAYLDMDGHERLQFSHESIQAFFASSRLLQADPATLGLEIILADRRWPTIAISLLENGGKEMVAGLIAAAERILSQFGQAPAAPAETMINRFLRAAQIPERDSASLEDVPPSSPALAYAVLRILDAGLQRQALLIPDTLREETDRLAAWAFPNSRRQEQEQIIEIQNLAHADVAAATCAAGLRSASGLLVRAAAAQITTRYHLLDLLTLRDRMRFALAVSLMGLDPWTAQHVSPAFRDRLRFMSYTSVVTASLFIMIFGLPGVIGTIANPSTWKGGVLEIAIVMALIAAIVAARRSDWGISRLMAGGIKGPFYVAVFLAAAGAFGLISEITGVLSGRFPDPLGLLAAGTFLWPLSALYYLAIESSPTLARWAFPFAVVLQPAWTLLRTRGSGVIAVPSRRTLGGIVVLVLWIADVAVLWVILKKGWHFPGLPLSAHRGLYLGLKVLAWLTLAVCTFVLPVLDWLHDARWLRQWMPSARASNEDVVSWFTQLRTTHGTVNMISAVERRLPTVAAQGAVDSLTDLCRVFEVLNSTRTKKGRTETQETLDTAAPLLTPGLEEFLKTYNGKNSGRLRKLARRHEKRLEEYLSAVKQSLDAADHPLPLVSSKGGVRSAESPSDT